MNSQYLKWFNEIEKSLWSFFKVFDPLCERCATRTLREVAEGRRDERNEWCCCMIDNQIHDTWQWLNPIQSRINRNWYDPLKKRKDENKLKMPGNGPCPALGSHGCTLTKLRPITCTTQLCSKMLVVLNKMGIIKTKTKSAMQIEDLIKLPDILPSLYGSIAKPEKVCKEDVQAYISAIRKIKNQMQAVSDLERKQIIEDATQL